jgi:hypothetical protein
MLGHSQMISKINFETVKKEIRDSTSSHYYPSLINRLLNKDTLLTADDYYFLYYGNIYQDYYHPYGSSNAKKEFVDTFSEQDYEKAVKKGEYVLAENPVDLEVLLKMSISYLKLENHEMKRYYAKQYYAFLEVIYGSGDGNYTESALVVISVDHEYDIVGDLGLRVVSQELINDCDLLYFSKKGQKKVKGKKKIKKMFFNVRMPLMSLSKTYKDADLPDPDDE